METFETPAGQIVTDTLIPNEVCYGLQQGPIGERWVQLIWVLRKGHWTKGKVWDAFTEVIAKHVTDCGPVSNFEKIAAQIIPGDDETTVDEFLYEAERHRHDLFAWNHLQKVKAESTLAEDFARGRENRRLYIRNQSVVGPYIKVERSMYNKEEAWRKWFDERARRTGKRKLHPSGGMR